MIKVPTEHGEITISDAVFTTITGAAATNCFGVKGMAQRSMTDGLVHLLRPEAMSKGVKVTYNDDNTVSIELHIVVENGVNGFVYHDEQEFRQYMAKLTTDAALRQRLGTAARQDVECRYSIPAFAAACLNVYRSLLPACAETTA